MYPFFHLHFSYPFIFLPSILTRYPSYDPICILQCTFLLSMYIVDAHYFTHNAITQPHIIMIFFGTPIKNACVTLVICPAILHD